MITHNVAISDPSYEVENLRYLTVKSSYLAGRGDITVFVPPGHEQNENLPMAILLHGVNASHWAWARQMNVHNIALEMIESGNLRPMILAMPSDGLIGGGSGYIKHKEYDFEKWIVEDVVEAVCSVIPQLSEQSKKFITGLSMGGYGALRIGSKYGQLFTAISGHSSILDLDDLGMFIQDGPLSIIQNETDNASVFQTILEHRENLPHMRFDCGTEDDLIDSNRRLHRQLNEENILHGYEEFPGGHTGAYWSKYIRKSLLFFNQHLA